MHNLKLIDRQKRKVDGNTSFTIDNLSSDDEWIVDEEEDVGSSNVDLLNILSTTWGKEIDEDAVVDEIGAYVNLEYTLPSGQKIRLLDDKKVYLGYQLEKENSDRCYGLVADNHFLLVCEYGCNGADPEIIVYKKR